MGTATVIVSIALAVLLAYTSFATFTGREVVRGNVVAVGFPPSLLWALGVAQLAGAFGLVVGLWWAPLALAAACGLVLYFIGAVGAHVRVGHPRRAIPSAVILLGCIAALVLVAWDSRF